MGPRLLIQFGLLIFFQRTRDHFIGTVFLVSCGISLLALACAIFIAISLKGKRIQDVAADGKAQEEENAREGRIKNMFAYDKGGKFSAI